MTCTCETDGCRRQAYLEATWLEGDERKIEVLCQPCFDRLEQGYGAIEIELLGYK